MRTVSLATLATLLVAASLGCTDPDVEGRVWACESDADCVTGFACREGACRPVEPDGAGGAPDGAGGAPDAGGGEDAAAPCECASGPCCDGCRFLPPTRSCGNGITYDCAGGPACGGIIIRRPVTHWCPGDGAGCDGETTPSGPWVSSRNCPLTHVCAAGSDYCRADASCDASGECVPACDGDACERCEDGTCRSACDAAACLTCNGAGGCRSLCDANACEVCDGAGACGSRCAVGYACDGAGGCVPATGCDPPCDADGCFVCGAGQQCVSACDPGACEVCDGSGRCRSTCDPATERCAGGRCVPTEEPPCHDPSARSFCDASVVSRVELVAASASCDRTGDGEGDSAIADVVALLAGSGGPSLAAVNADIRETLRTGAVLELLEYIELASDPADTPALVVSRYEGLDGDTDPTNNLYGGAALLVGPWSLTAGGEAVYELNDAQVSDGFLQASGDRLPVPGVLAAVGIPDRVTVEDVRLFARLQRDATGVSLTDGLLCGFVRMATVAEVANRYVAAHCGCLGVAGAMFVAGEGSVSCLPVSTDGCGDSADEQRCVALADYCGMLTLFSSGLPDLDTNGNDVPDALSVGVAFEAVPARITGVASQIDPTPSH